MNLLFVMAIKIWLGLFVLLLNNLIVSGSEDGKVRILAKDGTQLAEWRAHTKRVCTVFVTPDGKIVSGSAEEQTMLIWDMRALHLVACFSQMSNGQLSNRQRELIALLLDSAEHLMDQEYLRKTKARLITAECLVEEVANIQKTKISAFTAECLVEEAANIQQTEDSAVTAECLVDEVADIQQTESSAVTAKCLVEEAANIQQTEDSAAIGKKGEITELA